MREFVVTDDELAVMFETVLPHFDERQRRILVGAQARCLGRGGIVGVAEASGLSRATVQSGAAEVDAGLVLAERVRGPGAGRPRLAEVDATLKRDLEGLVDRDTRGDPMSPLRWTSKSKARLAEALGEMGHQVSESSVGRLLNELGFSLQATAKEIEGAQHPDRDGQFEWLNDQIGAHLRARQPVISVDAKKKETIGNLANKGREYEPKGDPVRVDVHDFPNPKTGKAVPYGVYDVAANEGFVVVGSDGDTSEFAVATISRWWDKVGRRAYPEATRLLITCDAGGSNPYRGRLWKREIAAFAARTGLTVTVCHFPPGTSKWNRIEHRLFSQISMNWRGRPLTSHEVIVELIGATTSQTGLTVRAERDTGEYPRGIKVTKAEIDALPIVGHRFHGEWNYTAGGKPLRPRRKTH